MAGDAQRRNARLSGLRELLTHRHTSFRRLVTRGFCNARRRGAATMKGLVNLNLALAGFLVEQFSASPSQGPSGAGTGAAGPAGSCATQAVDLSQQWAMDMVHVDSDEPLPRDAEAVRNFLSQALPKPLPVFQHRFDCLRMLPFTSELATKYLTVGQSQYYLPSYFELALNMLLNDAMCAVSFLGQFTEQLLLQLAALTRHLPLTAARNARDPTGTTADSARPDCCVWHKGALLFKGEDKVPQHSELCDAQDELGTKMARSWNVMAMGNLPFIVCYASCGAQLQYHIIMRDTNTALPVSDVFDLREVASRILALHTGVNVFRLLRLLARHIGDRQAPLYGLLVRSCGVAITIKMDSVVKHIAGFEQQPNVNPNINVLRQVYLLTRNEPHLVHAVRPPRLHNSKYSVELQPLGCHCRPASDAELRDAMRAVLRALVALHHHGFVHRDVRWDNVLRDSQGTWFLSDLEFAAEAGQAPPAGFRSISWTPHTLVNGLYTAASDIEQAGLMMLSCSGVSASGQALADGLTTRDAHQRPTALQALGHTPGFGVDAVHLAAA